MVLGSIHEPFEKLGKSFTTFAKNQKLKQIFGSYDMLYYLVRKIILSFVIVEHVRGKFIEGIEDIDS